MVTDVRKRRIKRQQAKKKKKVKERKGGKKKRSKGIYLCIISIHLPSLRFLPQLFDRVELYRSPQRRTVWRKQNSKTNKGKKGKIRKKRKKRRDDLRRTPRKEENKVILKSNCFFKIIEK
jgi:hypothetical protein